MLEVSVLHDRNPLFVKLSDGGVRNGYTVKLLNKLYEPRTLSSSASRACRARSSASSGMSTRPIPVVTVPPDELESIRVYVDPRQGRLRVHWPAPPTELRLRRHRRRERRRRPSTSAIFQGP